MIHKEDLKDVKNITVKPTAWATRHRCVYDVSVQCTNGNGKPTRKKCRYCGGSLCIEQGLWGVFSWRGDGRYPVENAHRTFVRESVADTWATATSPDYVVRWIYREDAQV